MSHYIDIVFDGPPDPTGGQFVEVENDTQCSINIGRWVERPDGYWVLRITREDVEAVLPSSASEENPK